MVRRRFKKPNGKTVVLRFICVSCLIVFCLSAYMTFSEIIRGRREARAFEELAAQIAPEEDTPAPSEIPEPPASKNTENIVLQEFHRYDALYEQNPDLFGWINIEGTKLNYPVMHTPDDPEHYLRRAFDGSYTSSGVPFLDGDCFTGCGNYIVYGHNMKNGTMFSPLVDYASEDFWQEHPTIRFDTVDAPGTYEILAVFYAKRYTTEDTDVFRYYNYADLTDEGIFQEYLQNVEAVALYDTGVTAEYGDQLLTLTTCSYHTYDGRLVVVAKAV